MALDPPGPVVMALNILGLPWPGVNEDQLHDWARSVRQFSADICDNSSQVNQTMRELADTSLSAVITSAADFWETHHQLLLDLRGPLDGFAEALDLAGYEVVAQKWAVIGAAGAMAAEFTATQIGAFFTFGADEAALPAELAITRETVKEALEKLTNALIGAGLQDAMQEIVDYLNRTMGSILNTAFEVHMEVHSLRILYETLRDTVQRIRNIINTIEEIASNAYSENVNRDLADSSGGGGWSEIIHIIEEGVKDFFKDLFKNLPSMIIQGLEALALGLLKLADRAEAADSDGSPGSPRKGSPAALADDRVPDTDADHAPRPESGSPDTEADRNPDSDLPTEIPRQFMDKLANLERWLEDEQIPYALFGSLAASAYIDQGRSLDFNRPHAHDPTERVPDIDLLVPRASLQRIKPYIEAVENSDFPVHIDTFWAECWVDLRPDAEYSYLTHRQLRLPVRSELFSPAKARLLGQEITTLDPRALLGLYGTVGVLRKKDVPRVTGLIGAIVSGAAPSRFTEQDSKVFDDFMRARKRRYPAFVVSKRAWAGLMGTLPAPAAQALKHYVGLPANEVRRVINRGQR